MDKTKPQCLYCNKLIKRKRKDGKDRWRKRKYCSFRCYTLNHESRKKGIVKICEKCHRAFYVPPYKKEAARFCSSNCWTTSAESRLINSNAMKKFRHINSIGGDKNPNWKGGLIPIHRLRLSRKQWRLIKAKMLRIYRYTCCICGAHKKLVVHHHVPYRYGGKDKTANLCVVCNRCHPTIEKRENDVYYTKGLRIWWVIVLLMFYVSFILIKFIFFEDKKGNNNYFKINPKP